MRDEFPGRMLPRHGQRNSAFRLDERLDGDLGARVTFEYLASNEPLTHPLGAGDSATGYRIGNRCIVGHAQLDAAG